MTKTILIIESDSALRQAMDDQLQQYSEYRVTSVASILEGMALLGNQDIDFAVIDEMAAQDETFRAARLQGEINVPVLLLAEPHSALDRADMDLMAKPFRFRDLLARLRQTFRQSENDDNTFRIGRYIFRSSAKLLLDEAGEKIYLTEKESNILRFLLQSGPALVTRELLLSEVWGYNSGVTTHTLETHIYRLRQKIERDPSNAEILVTDAGGYRLVP